MQALKLIMLKYKNAGADPDNSVKRVLTTFFYSSRHFTKGRMDLFQEVVGP